MDQKAPVIQLLRDDAEGSDSIVLLIRDPSVIEFEEDELTPAGRLTAWQARCLAHALVEMANLIEEDA
ncbi:MAG TPA: hypothetical protein VE734_10395 [Terriglobales bacterium]|nr:hypothetical protein [Terriglobales bacterium]